MENKTRHKESEISSKAGETLQLGKKTSFRVSKILQ